MASGGHPCHHHHGHTQNQGLCVTMGRIELQPQPCSKDNICYIVHPCQPVPCQPCPQPEPPCPEPCPPPEPEPPCPCPCPEPEPPCPEPEPCPDPCRPSPEPCPDLCPEIYRPPKPHPPVFPCFTERVTFGCDMKRRHFYLEEECTYLDQASYGCAIKEVVKAQVEWHKYVERQPTRILQRELMELSYNVRKRVANYIDADIDDIIFIHNVSVGMYSVIQSVVKTHQAGDEIIVTNLIYEPHYRFLKAMEERGIIITVVDIEVKSQRKIVKKIKESITDRTRLVVVDHVTVYGAHLPVADIVKVCHKRSVQVLVDGSHSFGPTHVSMREIDADFYAASTYRWFGNAKGCALVYVHKNHQSIVRPMGCSLGEVDFKSAFYNIGVIDCSAYMSLSVALDFWEFYGVKEIREYISLTAKEAGEYLVNEWGTSMLYEWDYVRHIVMVKLPNDVISHTKQDFDSEDAQLVESHLQKYGVEVPVIALYGSLYVRLSVHVHNCMEDIKVLACAVKKLRKACPKKKPCGDTTEEMVLTIMVKKLC